jgi:hypothetical protein
MSYFPKKGVESQVASTCDPVGYMWATVPLSLLTHRDNLPAFINYFFTLFLFPLFPYSSFYLYYTYLLLLSLPLPLPLALLPFLFPSTFPFPILFPFYSG